MSRRAEQEPTSENSRRGVDSFNKFAGRDDEVVLSSLPASGESGRSVDRIALALLGGMMRWCLVAYRPREGVEELLSVVCAYAAWPHGVACK